MKKSEYTQIYKGFTIMVKKVSSEIRSYNSWYGWTNTRVKSFAYSIPGKVDEEVSGYRNANAAFKAAEKKINSF